jgi:hypothetical protein
MPSLSQLEICNLALARLPAKEIASLDENSLEARECRRFYPQVISDLLGSEHAWSFANRRVILAAVVNDRPNEWLYAYALPNDLANPIRVVPDLTALGIAIPIDLGGNPYTEIWATQLEKLAMDYEIEGATLYTNASNATLEYAVNDIAGLNISQPAITFIAIDLAFRLAMPVKQSETREQALMGQAEIAKQRAIADDRNRQPDTYGDYTPENIAARHGFC